MRTCKYCGTELIFEGEFKEVKYFSCTFCEMDFTEEETSFDRKRKQFVPEYVDPSAVLTTKQMLKTDTITLFYSLRETNKMWFHYKSTLERYNKIELDEETKKMLHPIKDEYYKVTKQKFALENIILERTGFLPKKITEEFLNGLCSMGEVYNDKRMYIYIK